MTETPATPFRGITPFRYADHAIFFARAEESQRMTNLVMAYRGAMLYGDSGAGKSSLVNAGLLPEALGFGLTPERVRVQPRPGEEIVIERVALSEDRDEFVPSLLSSAAQGPSRVVQSIEVFERNVRVACEIGRPMLVFDQFEEIVTLFQDAEASEVQTRLVNLLVELMRGSLPVKVLFVFREDYLGRVKELLGACPELVDQALRLAPPEQDVLTTIIRGPFERHPGRFARELSPELALDLCRALGQRFGSGEVSLSEVQIVCLRLWQTDKPRELLAERGVQGLLEDYLGEALDVFPADVRAAAIALLGHMVTAAGTRNVISADDLIERVSDEKDISRSLFDNALERLERESKLVRRERRRDLDLYEITSEFLVPWISHQREELRRLEDRKRERRRLLIFGSIGLAGLLLALAIGALAIWAFTQRSDAQREATSAASLILSSAGQTQLENRLDVSLLLSLAAYHTSPRTEARSSMMSALELTRRAGTVAILRGDTEAVNDVAFSHNGQTLASAGAEGTVRLWNLHTDTEIGSPLVSGHTAFTSVAFSPDGRLLAASGSDGIVRLWNSSTGGQLGELVPKDHQFNYAYSIGFSPDGHMLAAGGYDGGVELWSLPSMKNVGELIANHKEILDSVAFSPDSHLLAAGGYRMSGNELTNGTLRLWNLGSMRTTGPSIAQHVGEITSVAFSPDGQALATGGYDETVRLWEVANRRQMGKPMPSGDITGVTFSPNGRTLAASGYYGVIELWNVATRVEQRYLSTSSKEPIDSVAFSPDGKTIASGDQDTTIRIWSTTPTQQPVELPDKRISNIASLAFSPNGRFLAIGGDSAGRDTKSGLVQLWDVASAKPLGGPLSSDLGNVSCIAFSPDGHTLAVAENDGSVQLWSIVTRAWIGELGAHVQFGFSSLAFSPSGATLAAGDYGGNIDLWSLPARKLVARLKTEATAINSIAFDSDGHTVASGNEGGEIDLWNTQSKRRIGKLFSQPSNLSSLTFSPDGRLLASGNDDGTVRLWIVATRRQLGHTLTVGNVGDVRVAFSPDGQLLATGDERDARLWDIATGSQLGQSLVSNSSIYAIAFDPHGRTLATGGGGGEASLWSGMIWGSFSELRQEVCKMVSGGLSRAEWTQYVPSLPYQEQCP